MARPDDTARRRPAFYVTAFPLIEDAVFTLLSAVVVLMAVALILTPPRLTFDLALHSAYAGGRNITVYGTVVDEAGRPIQGATATVYGANGHQWARVTTDANGVFSTNLKSDKGLYTVTIAYTVNGQPVTGSIVLDMQQGMSYGLQATLTGSNTIIFVPLPGY